MALKTILNLVIAAIIGAVILVAAADHGFAHKAKKRHRGYVGYVTAYSYYGNDSLTAPVRVDHSRGFASKQIRLPGGVWIDCAGSCAETLRVEKVDFWEQFSNGGGRKR